MLVSLLMSGISLIAQDTKTYTLEALEAKKRKEAGDNSIPVTTDAQFKERIEKISSHFPMRFNNLVKSHIKAYTERRRNSTATIIGRSAIYFPTFETSLMRHHIPTDLKYLSIVESALDPRATSPAGAKGLWQFMKGTGKQYNLRISKYVDERSDPQMSSDAAATYLKDLYARYGDWALSIAAYNCGPGRVNSAVKKAGKSDYWAVMKYLPKETRNYVPAFIAAAYTMNYYHLHNIYPEFPEYDLQVTEHVKIHKKATFKDIAEMSGTDFKTVKFLNPSYKLDFIPTSKVGYVLTLPMSKMTAYRAANPEAEPLYFAPMYEESTEGQPYLASTTVNGSSVTTGRRIEYKQVKTIYNVKKGDNLGKIANKQSVSVSNLRKWNKLKGSLLSVNQKLVIYKTERVVIEEVIAETPVVEENRKVAYYVDGKPVYTQKVMTDEDDKKETPMAVTEPLKETATTEIPTATIEKTSTVPQEYLQETEMTVADDILLIEEKPAEDTEIIKTVETVKAIETVKKIETVEAIETVEVETIETTGTVETAAIVEKDNRVVDYYLDGKPVYAQRLQADPTNAIAITQPVQVIEMEEPAPELEAVVKAPNAKEEIFHHVRRGDTLWKISKKYSDVSVKDLMKWNKITHHNQLRPGMKLKITTSNK
jgi:membrane-bound lytic murein transglycosylase D